MPRRSSSRAGSAQGASQAERPRRGSRSRRQGPPPPGEALDAGLRLLGRRAHSRVELHRKLARRGFDAETVERTLARLAELGYLDDGAFAAGLVRRRASLRGPLALSAELAARGVDRRLADTALGAYGTDEQLASATRLAERLYARSGATSQASDPPPGYREMLDKVGSKLMRRGFSASTAREACWAVLERRGGAPGA